MGGQSFTSVCSLIKNSYSYEVSALIDSGANGTLFINESLANKLIVGFDTKAHRFPTTGYATRSFDGSEGKTITRYLELSLEISGRRYRNLPFLITPLGSHDLIIGRKWLQEQKVYLDMERSRIVFPASNPPTQSFDKLIRLTADSLKERVINPVHQTDVHRLERLHAEMEARGTLSTIAILNHRITSAEGKLFDYLQKDLEVSELCLASVPSLEPQVPPPGYNFDPPPIGIQKDQNSHDPFSPSLKREEVQPAIEKDKQLTAIHCRLHPSDLGTPLPDRPTRVLSKGLRRMLPLNGMALNYVPPHLREEPTSQSLHDRQRIVQMRNALDEDYVPQPKFQPKEKRTPEKRTPGACFTKAETEAIVNVAVLSAVGFNLVRRRDKLQVYSVTIDEIDKELQHRAFIENQHLFEPVVDLNDPDALAVAAHSVMGIDYVPDETLVDARLKEFSQYAMFKDVFSKRASDELPPFRDSVDHKIDLKEENTIGHAPLYRQSTEELLAVKQYLMDNLDKGFIVPSNSPFASPVLFVKKQDGSLRFCVDYRKLNALTIKDQHPLPLIDETLARISQAKIFTKLDIRQAFNRIRVDPDSEELTTFRTRYGTFKYKVLPFGLTNGPATYQRYMNKILFDFLDDFCTAYLDDILIYSNNLVEHETHVKKVLARLREAGLQVDIKKTEFHTTRTKYLGFIISTNGIEVDPEKIEAITKWKVPRNVKAVQSFLGFCNFYRRFIKDYGRVAHPLHNLCRKDLPWYFDASCKTAFETLQRMLTTTPLLQHYNRDYETQLETDASDGVVAGVMSQRKKGSDDEWLPVGYYSKTMNPAEMNYQIHDKEMLAIVQSFKQWRADLTSATSSIQVWTDHRALEYFMSTKTLNQRQARWAEILADFDFLISYRAGKDNGKPDLLTRLDYDTAAQQAIKSAHRTTILLPAKYLDPQIVQDLKVQPQGCDLNGIALAALDSNLPVTFMDDLFQANRTHPSLEEHRELARKGHADWTLTSHGLLLFKTRLELPESNEVLIIHTELIKAVHASLLTAHPGVTKTMALLRRFYHWKGMQATVERYIANCHECGRAAIPRDKTPGFLHPLPIPDRPYQHLSMDFMSYSKDQHGYDMVFVVMDRLSKKSLSIPCHKKSGARELAAIFLVHVFRHHGFPKSIVSDRGPQFISSFWNEFCEILGIKVKLSTAFHPQTDGQTEIMNQYLTLRLRPFMNHYQNNWSELLPMMDYAQLTLKHSSIGMTPFELLNGYPADSTWNWETALDPNKPITAKERLNRQEAQDFAKRMHDAWLFAREVLQKKQNRMAETVNKGRREINWEAQPDNKPNDKVYISTKNWKTNRPSRKLGEQQAGPFEVIAKEGHSFRVQLPNSMAIHPVFNPEKLRKDPNNPLPGQNNPEPEPLYVTEDAEYEVQDIIAVKSARGSLKYRAQWVGCDDDPEWYPASDFKYSPLKLREFHLANPALPGPPAQLEVWTRAYNEGSDDYDKLNSNKAATESSRASFFRRGGNVTILMDRH